MSYTDNLYLKRIAGTLTSPIEGRHTNNYYLKIISKNIGKGGGGGSYDDTEIKRRMTAVENGKQDKLTAGQNITISGNTITAREIINDTINSATTVWSSNKIKDLIEGLEGGAKVSIVATRPDPSVAEEKTMYYVGTSAPFHIWFFVNNSYTDVGTTDINLENYFTKDEINALLAGKVDKENGKVLIPTEDLAQITTNKNDIADLDSDKVDKVTGKSLVLDTDITQITTNKTDIATNTEDIADLKTDKQDKITDSTLSSLADTTTVSSVSATDKTNKTFTLSALWNYIKGKITGGASTILTSNLTASRALVSNTNGKVGVSDVTSTELGKLSGVTNTLKLETFTGDNAYSFTNVDANLKSMADWSSDIPRKAWKMNGVVGLSFHLKCNCTFNISGGWIYIGTVPSGLRPKHGTAVLVDAWSANATRPVNGYVQTNGVIKVWVDSLPVNTNTQFRMNATWSTV